VVALGIHIGWMVVVNIFGHEYILIPIAVFTTLRLVLQCVGHIIGAVGSGQSRDGLLLAYQGISLFVLQILLMSDIGLSTAAAFILRAYGWSFLTFTTVAFRVLPLVVPYSIVLMWQQKATITKSPLVTSILPLTVLGVSLVAALLIFCCFITMSLGGPDYWRSFLVWIINSGAVIVASIIGLVAVASENISARVKSILVIVFTVIHGVNILLFAGNYLAMLIITLKNLPGLGFAVIFGLAAPIMVIAYALMAAGFGLASQARESLRNAGSSLYGEEAPFLMNTGGEYTEDLLTQQGYVQ